MTAESRDLIRPPVPGDDREFLNQVDAHRRLGRLDDARRIALRGLERHPHDADAHDALARVMADLGDEGAAQDEWEFALRLDPGHEASLKGLGFLAWKRRDLARAEGHLARALQRNPGDDGLAIALRRVRIDLRGSNGHHDGTGLPAAAAERGGNGTEGPPSAGSDARRLFAPLLGDRDCTALLLDRDGLVLAGTYVDAEGEDVAEEIGAHLAGLADEASRALDQLGLGRWVSLLVEAQHATVALGPAPDGAVVLVAAARDTQVGLVRRLLTHAGRRATDWLGGGA